MQLAQEDAQAQQMLGQIAPEMVADFAQSKLEESEQLAKAAANTDDPEEKARLTQQANALEENWGEDGAARITLHTLTGALSGGVDSALGNLVTAAGIPTLDNILTQVGYSKTEKDALRSFAR